MALKLPENTALMCLVYRSESSREHCFKVFRSTVLKLPDNTALNCSVYGPETSTEHCFKVFSIRH